MNEENFSLPREGVAHTSAGIPVCSSSSSVFLATFPISDNSTLKMEPAKTSGSFSTVDQFAVDSDSRVAPSTRAEKRFSGECGRFLVNSELDNNCVASVAPMGETSSQHANASRRWDQCEQGTSQSLAFKEKIVCESSSFATSRRVEETKPGICEDSRCVEEMKPGSASSGYEPKDDGLRGTKKRGVPQSCSTMNAAKNVNCVSSAVYEDVLSDTSDPQRKLAGSKRTRWDMEEWGKGAGHARPSTSDSPFADITVGGNTGSYTSPSDIETPRSPQTPILSKTVEGSSHSSAETKNVSSTELSVSEEYPCMLPLNTALLRSELLNRLQLALWGLKTQHSKSLQDLESERQKSDGLSIVLMEVLRLIIRHNNECSNFLRLKDGSVYQESTFDKEDSSLKACRSSTNSPAVGVEQPRRFKNEGDSMEIDGCNSPTVLPAAQALASNSVCTAKGENEVPSNTSDNVSSQPPEESEKGGAYVWETLWPCVDHLLEAVIKYRRDLASKELRNDVAVEMVEMFLMKASAKDAFRSERASDDTFENNGMTVEKTKLSRISLENWRLSTALTRVKTECERFKLLVEQCRKQISIYLSRDPLTPAVLTINGPCLTPADDICFEAPEVVLSCIPRLVRVNRHLRCENETKIAKLNAAVETISALRKETTHQALQLATLQTSVGAPNSGGPQALTGGSLDKVLQLENQDEVKRILLQNAKLAADIHALTSNRVQEQESLEQCLRERCDALQKEKRAILEQKNAALTELSGIKLENEKQRARLAELEASLDFVSKRSAATSRDISAFFKSSAEQRSSRANGAVQENGSLEGSVDPKHDPTSGVSFKSLLVQRDHLTLELDELSAAFEEKLEEIALLEQRCKERDERCLALVEEGLQRKNRNSRVEQQIQQFIDTIKQNEATMSHLQKEITLQTNSLKACADEKLQLLQRAASKDQALANQREKLQLQESQIRSLESQLDKQKEKNRELQHRFTLLQDQLRAVVESQTYNQFISSHSDGTSSSDTRLDLPQVSEFLRTSSRSVAEGNTSTPKVDYKLASAPRTPKTSSDAASVLQLELDALRSRFLCTLCNERWKNAFVRRCGHSFCQECLKKTLASRNRKCPQCNQKYQATDIQRIFVP